MVALAPLLAAVKRDSDDLEIVKNIIEVFLVICGEPEDDVLEPHAALPNISLAKYSGASEYCEIIMKDREAVHIVIALLKDDTLYLRYSILQFLQLMARKVYDELAAAILSFPSGGFSSMVDLLEDKREVIRNELLLLLVLLTEKNTQIQRLAILESTIEKLFGLIEECGGIYGGEVIVEDAIKIIRNLLRYNPFNQNYFRESDCFRQIQVFLSTTNIPLGSVKWNSQVCNNVIYLLQLISLMCYRGHPKLNVIQTAFSKLKIVEILAQMATMLDIPCSVRAVALQTLSGLLFSNKGNQEIVAHCVFPSSFLDPRPFPTLVIVIKTAIDNGDNHELRMSAIDAIGAYLSENKDGQMVIAATFKSPRVDGSPSSTTELSAGSMIIGALLDLQSSQKKSKSLWYSSLLLSHIIRGNEECKRLTATFRPKDSSSAESEDPVELFDLLLLNLIDSVKHEHLKHASLGLLIVFATWLKSSPVMISRFVREGSNIQFLIELINQNSSYDPMIQGFAGVLFGICILEQQDEGDSQFNRYEGGFVSDTLIFLSREALIEVAKNRIGLDVFVSRLQRLQDRILQFQANRIDASFPQSGDLFDESYASLATSVKDSLMKILLAPKDGLLRKPAHRNVSVETDDDDQQKMAAELSNLNHLMSSLQIQVAQKDAIIANLTASRPDSESEHELAKSLEIKLNYMVVENDRLQKLSDAYSSQIVQIEQDHQELMETLLVYEQELAAYRGMPLLQEQLPTLASPQPHWPSAVSLRDPNLPSAVLNNLSSSRRSSEEAIFKSDKDYPNLPASQTDDRTESVPCLETAASHFIFDPSITGEDNFFANFTEDSTSHDNGGPILPFVTVLGNDHARIQSAPIDVVPADSERPSTVIAACHEDTVLSKTLNAPGSHSSAQNPSIMDFLKPKTPTSTTHDV